MKATKNVVSKQSSTNRTDIFIENIHKLINVTWHYVVLEELSFLSWRPAVIRGNYAEVKSQIEFDNVEIWKH